MRRSKTLDHRVAYAALAIVFIALTIFQLAWAWRSIPHLNDLMTLAEAFLIIGLAITAVDYTSRCLLLCWQGERLLKEDLDKFLFVRILSKPFFVGAATMYVIYYLGIYLTVWQLVIILMISTLIAIKITELFFQTHEPPEDYYY